MSGVGPYEIVLSVAGTSRLAHLARRRDGEVGREFILIPLELSGDDALRLEDELARCRKVDHPAIATVFELFEYQRSQVLAFERFGGTNLRRLLHYLETTGRALSDAARLHIGFVLFDALAAAHEATDVEGQPSPIVHGHLGPHQVLIASGGAVSIFGFGLARPYELGRAQRGPSDLLPFVAPENRAGAAPTSASNVYSAAATVWTLLVGQPPSADGRLGSVAKLRPDLPRAITVALDRALQPVAALRSITSRELAIALAQSSDSHGPRELGQAMAACRGEADVDGGFIPPESLPPRLATEQPAQEKEQSSAEQRRTTWTSSNQPELSPAEQQAVQGARRRAGRQRKATPSLQNAAPREHVKVRSAARRRGVTMPGSRRSPLADMGDPGPRSRRAKRRAADSAQASSTDAAGALAPNGGPTMGQATGALAESEPPNDGPDERPEFERGLGDMEQQAERSRAERSEGAPAAAVQPAEPAATAATAAGQEQVEAPAALAAEDDAAFDSLRDESPAEPTDGSSAEMLSGDALADEPLAPAREPARTSAPAVRAPRAIAPDRPPSTRSDDVDWSPLTDGPPRARRLPVKWLVAAILLAVVSFVTGLVISIGPISVHFGQQAPASSDPGDDEPTDRPAVSTAAARSAPAPSVESHPPVPVPTAAPPPVTTDRPTAPTSAPVDAEEGSALPPEQGYLVVRSSATTLHVYSNGKRVGPTNERLPVGCGMKHLRLGDRPLETWHSKGRAVAVDCQSVTKVVIEPDTPVPVGGPMGR